MTTKASLQMALENWGRVMHRDLTLHQSHLPGNPPTSNQYRADNQSDDNLEPSPDETWAISVQAAWVRLNDRHPKPAEALLKFYRDRKTVSRSKLAEAHDKIKLFL